jgi:hypothetical protein
VLKKASRNSREASDVTADDPVGTMDRFTHGLKRVLAAPKIQRHAKATRTKRKKQITKTSLSKNPRAT